MTPYATYNEYYAAQQTVNKLLANPYKSGRDEQEMLIMIARIKLTDKMNMQWTNAKCATTREKP